MKARFIHHCIHVMGLYFIADPDGQWIEILPEM